MSELSPTHRSGMSLSELDPLLHPAGRLGKRGRGSSEGRTFTACHIWGGLTSLECESFFTFITILNWDLCGERERDLFFTVYLQTSFPIRLCLWESKFNIPIKGRRIVKRLFCLHNTKWLVQSMCLTELVWSGVDTLLVSVISNCSPTVRQAVLKGASEWVSEAGPSFSATPALLPRSGGACGSGPASAVREVSALPHPSNCAAV